MTHRCSPANSSVTLLEFSRDWELQSGLWQAEVFFFFRQSYSDKATGLEYTKHFAMEKTDSTRTQIRI